jgi:TonB family protein
VIRRIEPQYSPEARAEQIQGTVVLRVMVDEKGRPADIWLVSPIGYGLDQQAWKAVEQWQFAPGTSAGVPVKAVIHVEVPFRLSFVPFDEKAERQRSAFNIALKTVERPNTSREEIDRAVNAIQELCQQKFGPAMYIAGAWMMNGEHVHQDLDAGFDWVQQSAAKNYGPALYLVGLRRIEGHRLPRDPVKGLEEMRQAATLGSRQAQFYLGQHYEIGDGVPREIDRARGYYRLCAAQGAADCQYRLGRLLYDEQARQERDYLQAIALFQLAAEQGVTEARKLALNEAPKLTAEQSTWVSTLKREIVQR